MSLQWPKKPPHKPGYRVEEIVEDVGFDTPGASWDYGRDGYTKVYRCYVPIALADDNVSRWLAEHEDAVVWINDDGTARPTLAEEWEAEQAELGNNAPYP